VTVTERARVKSAAKSHPGMSGKNNEDRFAVTTFEYRGSVPGVLAVVADGIGGHRAGEVAAEIAVEAISKQVTSRKAVSPVALLEEALQQADRTIYNQAEINREHHGMGATCACALIVDKRLYIAYVGDSRIYLIRAGHLYQLSVDHTWIQEALEHGAITPQEAADHPNAHVIRRYLGSRNPVEPDLRMHLPASIGGADPLENQGLNLLPGDRILLCSDGLTDLVNNTEVLSILKSTHIETAPDKLIELANRRGGHDNITVVVLEVQDTDLHKGDPALPRRGNQSKLLACAGIGAIFLAGLVLMGSLFTLYQRWITKPITVSATPSAVATLGAIPTISERSSGTQTPQASRSDTPPPGLLLPGSGTPSAPNPTLTPWPTNTQGP
jgi:serine/threonine protein phosphatase PrpC